MFQYGKFGSSRRPLAPFSTTAESLSSRPAHKPHRDPTIALAPAPALGAAFRPVVGTLNLVATIPLFNIAPFCKGT